MNKKHLTNQGEKKLIAQDNISKIKGSNKKAIDSNQQKKEKTKLKREILPDDITENRK